MLRSPGRTAAASLIAALTAIAGACASERAAPVLTPPPPPSTTTTTTSTPPAPETTTALGAGPEARPPRATPSTTTTTTPPVPPVDPSAWAAFDLLLADRLLGAGDYAVSVAVSVHGELVHTGAFGHRVPPPPTPRRSRGRSPQRPQTGRRPRPERVEPGDRFRIASLSKIITATVVLQLVESGAIALDQPVGRRLGEHVGVEVRDPGVAGVTVRQLLSHTSGLPGRSDLLFDGGADSCEAAARIGLSGTLALPPATRYSYSNFGYCLLGLLVEKVTGNSYEDEVRRRLLEPLGITGMRLAGTFDPDPNEVQHPSVPTRTYMEALGAAGAWVATPADMVKIVDSLDPSKPGWHPLSSRMLELMRRPLVRRAAYPHPGERWYGLGLMVWADGSTGHTGTLENTHAMVVSRPDGVTWALLVSGLYPWDSDDLMGIFHEAAAEAGLPFA